MTAEKEFNLLEEPWIRVIDCSGATRELGLLECFRRAHELKGIAGELPTQDVAVLRLLLAIMYAVFGQVDASGGRADLSNSEKALTHWRTLRERNRFSMEFVEKYLRFHEDRFWLFHPERPFYQIPGVQGTSYGTAKLIGDISESNNKPRMFAIRSGGVKKQLEYGEAARWLLYLNAFDDNSSKPSPKAKGKASVGPGWLGRLGLVHVEGETLFETLFLNWVLFDPFTRETYSHNGKPCWEGDMRIGERVKIPTPENPLPLLTLQTRRIALTRDERLGVVIGFTLVHGDGFDLDNVFVEHMTMWGYNKKENVYRPRPFDPAVQLWRDFQPLTALDGSDGNQRRPPGVIAWLSHLADREIIPRSGMMRIRSAGVKYDEKFFYVKDVFADSLSVNYGIFSNLAKNEWLPILYTVIETTDKTVKAFGELAENVFMASGGTGKTDVAASARRDAYFSIDLPFRNWLSAINPDDDKNIRGIEWLNLLRKLLLEQSDKLFENTARKAMTGVVRINEKTNRTEYCNAFTAFSKFRAGLEKIVSGTGGKK